MSAKVVRLPFPNDYRFGSIEDNEILLERLRVHAEQGFTLRSAVNLIPHAMSIQKHRRVSMIYCCDLLYILGFLEDNPKPSLEELQLITRIMARWRANHERTIPFYDEPVGVEEAEANRRIREVIRRLIEKGQFTTDETEHTE
jgi:hypothetical protein